VQFNTIASAITNGLDQLAGGMIAGLGGGGAGSAYFAAAFDDLIAEFGNYLNAAGDNMHWMAGALIGAIGAFLFGRHRRALRAGIDLCQNYAGLHDRHCPHHDCSLAL